MTKVLTFKSRPNVKLLVVGFILMFPSLLLIKRGFFVLKILPRVPSIGIVHFVIGGVCLLALLYFLVKHITPKKVIVDAKSLEIQYGSNSYKIPWKDVQSISHSRHLGGKSFSVITSDRVFSFMESDFPNFKVLSLAFSQIKEQAKEAKFLELS